jgi:hypothetical protein
VAARAYPASLAAERPPPGDVSKTSYQYQPWPPSLVGRFHGTQNQTPFVGVAWTFGRP